MRGAWKSRKRKQSKQNKPKLSLKLKMDLLKSKSIFYSAKNMFNLFNLFAPSPKTFPLQVNDGGRAAAGFKGGAGDCVVRSIAIAANLPYMQVYEDLREANERYAQERDNKLSRFLNQRGSSPRNGNHRHVFHDYILSHGFQWVPTMQVGAGCKVHLRPDELPKGTLIVKVSKHLTTIIDGVIHDTHNPSRGGSRCVYGYYLKSPPGFFDHT
jgi:hypothetical protein